MLKINVTNCTRDGKPFTTADALREAYDAPPLRDPVRRYEDTFSAETVVMEPVDHSIFFTAPPPQPAVTTGKPMQLYCYVKQLDDVRAFMRRLDISKHVCPIRSAWEIERLGAILRGQVFVHFPDHEEPCHALTGLALIEGMFVMEINVGEGHS